jgi:hypothetical protein
MGQETMPYRKRGRRKKETEGLGEREREREREREGEICRGIRKEALGVIRRAGKSGGMPKVQEKRGGQKEPSRITG